MAILNVLLICAALGVVGAIIEKVWGHVEDILAWLLSFFLPGIGLGLILFIIMGAGYLFGIFGNIYIFGIHSFMLGFIIGTIREFFLCIKEILARR